MGLPLCIAYLVGAMVGSAIFSLSGLTILQAGPAALLSWFLAGGIMLGFGLCMAELAGRYPQSGGMYYFPRLAFPGKSGMALGWLSCWSAILTNVVAIAFSAIYVGLYFCVAFPQAARFHWLVGLLSVALCFFMHLLRVELAGKINGWIVAGLVGTILVYAFCACRKEVYSVALLQPFFHQGTEGPWGFLKAVPVALIGYSGIVSLAFVPSQVNRPGQTIPRAMGIAMVAVVLLYLLVIFATVGLVSVPYLAQNPDKQFLPLFAACEIKFSHLPWLADVVSLSAVLALLTTMYVCISMNAWAIYAAGREGILPRFLGTLSSRGIPLAASAATSLFAAAGIFLPGLIQKIVNFGAVFNLLTMVITLAALLKSRSATGNRPEFFLPGGVWLPAGILGILLACNISGVLFGGAFLWEYTLLFLALGIGLFCFRRKPPEISFQMVTAGKRTSVASAGKQAERAAEP